MKALILAAGKGTRVRPLTYAMPKPMVPILHRPVLEILVHHLRHYGFDRIMVNTSYLASQLENYFRDGAAHGVQMAYSFEGRLEGENWISEALGSAGAIKKIQEHSGFFDDTFLVMCGDALIDLDLDGFLDFHRRKKAQVSVSLLRVERDQVSHYGIARTGPDDRILAFQEKPKVEEALSNLANTGIYLFEPEVIDAIPSGGIYDIGSQLFPALAEQNAGIYGADIPFQWLDIGTVSDYYHVLQNALRGRVQGVSPRGDPIGEGIWAGLNVKIDLARCEIEPPVVLGGSVEIQPGCRLMGPVYIGSGSVIESGAVVERSVIFDYTRLGPQAHVKEMMICGGYCVDSAGTVIDLAQSDIDWVIRDARRRSQPSPEQEQMLALLQEIQSMPRANP